MSTDRSSANGAEEEKLDGTPEDILDFFEENPDSMTPEVRQRLASMLANFGNLDQDPQTDSTSKDVRTDEAKTSDTDQGLKNPTVVGNRDSQDSRKSEFDNSLASVGFQTPNVAPSRTSSDVRNPGSNNPDDQESYDSKIDKKNPDEQLSGDQSPGDRSLGNENPSGSAEGNALKGRTKTRPSDIDGTGAGEKSPHQQPPTEINDSRGSDGSYELLDLASSHEKAGLREEEGAKVIDALSPFEVLLENLNTMAQTKGEPIENQNGETQVSSNSSETEESTTADDASANNSTTGGNAMHQMQPVPMDHAQRTPASMRLTESRIEHASSLRDEEGTPPPTVADEYQAQIEEAERTVARLTAEARALSVSRVNRDGDDMGNRKDAVLLQLSKARINLCNLSCSRDRALLGIQDQTPEQLSEDQLQGQETPSTPDDQTGNDHTPPSRTDRPSVGPRQLDWTLGLKVKEPRKVDKRTSRLQLKINYLAEVVVKLIVLKCEESKLHRWAEADGVQIYKRVMNLMRKNPDSAKQFKDYLSLVETEASPTSNPTSHTDPMDVTSVPEHQLQRFEEYVHGQSDSDGEDDDETPYGGLECSQVAPGDDDEDDEDPNFTHPPLYSSANWVPRCVLIYKSPQPIAATLLSVDDATSQTTGGRTDLGVVHMILVLMARLHNALNTPQFISAAMHRVSKDLASATSDPDIAKQGPDTDVTVEMCPVCQNAISGNDDEAPPLSDDEQGIAASLCGELRIGEQYVNSLTRCFECGQAYHVMCLEVQNRAVMTRIQNKEWRCVMCGGSGGSDDDGSSSDSSSSDDSDNRSGHPGDGEPAPEAPPPKEEA